ncbi:RING finger and transmembrane domain-containing protein [Arachis hypogaea]|nr:RING finger and transmembrane domain-containing protein [Arachis hypogaea]
MPLRPPSPSPVQPSSSSSASPFLAATASSSTPPCTLPLSVCIIKNGASDSEQCILFNLLPELACLESLEISCSKVTNFGINFLKVQAFFAAVKELSRKEVHYGSYATSEQVIAAGDLCAICQEKMHAPILLRCKHIFCEDCVSEWFERERTCPLCRALVKPADLRSFGDGSTSLFFQLF